MNKIIVDKENNIDLKDNAIELDIKVKELVINIKGKVLINEINTKENEELNLTINIEPNSSLLYNRFLINNTVNNNITLNQNNNSNLTLNYSLIINDKSSLKINSNLFGNDNDTEIKVCAVTEKKGSVVVSSTADAKQNISNNNLLEDIRVLLLNDEESVVIPNLLVSSNEVETNHAATISSVDKDYLFYLNSKGIDDVNAISLIKNGYLLSKLDIDNNTKEKIKRIIGGEENES